MIQSFDFMYAAWRDPETETLLREQLRRSEPASITASGFTLEFRPDRQVIRCRALPERRNAKTIPAELSYEGLGAFLDKRDPPTGSINYL